MINDNSEIREISLPKGGTLQITMSPEFLNKVRSHFSIPTGVDVSDEHIRMFVYGSCKTAIDKAENNIVDKDV